MAKNKRTKRPASEQSGDEAHQRINGASYDATEPERIRDLERDAQRPPATDDEFVTDAELEAREIDWPSDED